MKRTSIATSIHSPTAAPELAVKVYGARVSDWVGDAVGVSLVDSALEVKDNIDVVLAAAVEGPRLALSRENTAVSVSQHRCFSASDSQQNCASCA
jgi:hypothetical protein